MASDLPADLITAVGDRFDLLRVLGRGGMATVYLARDKKHHRQVALKVLLPGLSAYLGPERFLKEIEIAARLTHPHILPLHDSGEAGGFLYYVMPYIEGGSLRQRLNDRGRLPLDEALDIARPVADALGYAHRMGVLHRDIKPENILFSQGHPVVADFGIARAVTTAGGANLTRTGFPIGTPGYMSPEQAAGLTELDEKADVYSLAVVIYEMLVGEIPGRWPTEEEVRVGRFLNAPATHRSRLTALGGQVEAALVRALAIRQDQRTATPQALIAGLSGGPSGERRRYSEGEVQAIVQRATELEASRPTQSGAMTIGGVEALAAEVGIEPKLVREAAGSLDPASSAPPVSRDSSAQMRNNPWIGGPTKLLYERTVEGELPEGEYATLVDEIRLILQDVGQVSQLGHSFSWASTRAGSTRHLEVSVSVRGGRTRITARENLGPLIGGIFGGVGGGVGGGGFGPIMATVGSALHASGAAFVAIIPAWLGTVYLSTRLLYRRAVRRRAATLERLVDRLAELTASLAREQSRLRG
ncbi:MAG TPA: serine/threonine-protein kinase [Gemmatimonadales bacterium]|nr:serine/threonine-protein kinase [Gemmatimonadales bacterium]